MIHGKKLRVRQGQLLRMLATGGRTCAQCLRQVDASYQDTSGGDTMSVPEGTFSRVRGSISHEMGLRLYIRIPDGVVGTGDNEGGQLIVSDLIDTSNKAVINYGAQFADYLHVGVHAVARPADKVADPLGCACEDYKPKSPTNGEEPQVFALMAVADGLKNKFPLRSRRDIRCPVYLVRHSCCFIRSPGLGIEGIELI